MAEEFEQGLTAVAATVRNPTGKVVAAVNAFGPSFRFPARGRQQLAAQAVVATAALCALFYSQGKSDLSEKLNTLAGKKQNYKLYFLPNCSSCY